jgi:hypothetical protein
VGLLIIISPLWTSLQFVWPASLSIFATRHHVSVIWNYVAEFHLHLIQWSNHGDFGYGYCRIQSTPPIHFTQCLFINITHTDTTIWRLHNTGIMTFFAMIYYLRPSVTGDCLASTLCRRLLSITSVTSQTVPSRYASLPRNHVIIWSTLRSTWRPLGSTHRKPIRIFLATKFPHSCLDQCEFKSPRCQAQYYTIALTNDKATDSYI